MRPAAQSVIVKGIAWRAAADFGQQALQIAFTAILARILSRADYGLVAMAMLFIRMIQSIGQVGFGSAIIQSRDATNGQVSAVFILQCAVNLVISLAAYAGAPLAAEFFNEPRVTGVVRVLCWLQFLNSFSFPQVLMQRDMRFARYSFLEIVALLAGNAVGIVLAFQGYGVWALVGIHFMQRILFIIPLWPLAGWRPARPAFTGAMRLVRFGMHMQVSHIFHYFSQNMIAIITGRFIGVETLGSLNIALNLAIVPAQKIQSVLTSVLAPAYARLSGEDDLLRATFRKSLFSLGVFFVPAMFGLSAVAENLVMVVFGSKWRDSGSLLAFLAFVGLLKGVEHLLRSVILSRGWGAAAISRVTMVETVVGLPLLFSGVYLAGVNGLIGGYLLASILAFLLSARFAEKAVNAPGIVMSTMNGSMLVSAFMFLLVYGISFIPSLSHGALLGIQVIVGAAVYLAARRGILSEDEKHIVAGWPFSDLILGRR